MQQPTQPHGSPERQNFVQEMISRRKIHTSFISSLKSIIIFPQAGLNTIELLLWARGKSLKEVRKRLKEIQEGLQGAKREEDGLKVELPHEDSDKSDELDDDDTLLMMKMQQR